MHNDTYDFFISYDSSYQSQADKLVNELEKKSLKCFAYRLAVDERFFSGTMLPQFSKKIS